MSNMDTFRSLIGVLFLFLSMLVRNSMSFAPIISPTSLNSNPSLTQLHWVKEKQQQTEWISQELLLNELENAGCTQNDDDQQQQPMKIVPPLADDVAMDILRRVDSCLREPDAQAYFDELIQQGDTSVRCIQAGRYEVFLKADEFGKGTAAFDWIAAKIAGHPADCTAENIYIKEVMLDYAERQANTIGRYKDNKYVYHNFAFLVNYDECPQQYPHIDSLSPNAQFCLAVTDGAAGTLWFEPKQHIQSARDLQQAWSLASSGDVHSCNEWVNVMEEDDKVGYWLQNYGSVLSPNLEPYQPNQGTPLRMGTLMALPGGVVHAGPPCDGFRCVLFFSGYPKDDDVPFAPYNPDSQYFGSMLMSDIIARTWTKHSVGDRRYLLERLVEYLEQPPANNRKMHRHLKVGSDMYEFAGYTETGMMVGDDFNRYLDEFTSREELEL